MAGFSQFSCLWLGSLPSLEVGGPAFFELHPNLLKLRHYCQHACRCVEAVDARRCGECDGHEATNVSAYFTAGDSKYNFTNRVIPIWNSLSNHVVSADTVNCFKNRLDKFSSSQIVLYDYKADLDGIGNRSILELSFLSELIAELANRSFREGGFPSCFKHASVVPLLKKNLLLINMLLPVTGLFPTWIIFQKF